MRRWITRYSYVNDRCASLDGKTIATATGEGNSLTAFYRALKVDYPRFFKMDTLSKLGFLASELIFERDEWRFSRGEEVAIICFNRGSSLESDVHYQATIQERESYFPSPSLFVYTLPNIVTAEIAIRNKLHGETAFYLQERFDARPVFERVSEAFQDAGTRAVLAAWIESFDAREAFMMLVEERDTLFDFPFSGDAIVELLNKSRNG
jgi:3-oxoacyl-[acyl-carrier-protein] synthase-1